MQEPHKGPGFGPWVGKTSWRRKWQPAILVSLPGKFHRQKTLVGYSPWGCRVGHDWTCSLLYQCKVLTVILFLVPPGGRGLDSTIPPAARGFCPCFGKSFLFFLPKQTNLASIYLPELWIFVCALVNQRPYAPFPVAEVFDSQERKVWEWRWGFLPVFLLPLITSWCLCPCVLPREFFPKSPVQHPIFLIRSWWRRGVSTCKLPLWLKPPAIPQWPTGPYLPLRIH